ncbi:oxalate/formate antiporter family transporter [uncultured Roseburia sp.]|uniref:MFS transporter n=1 Tax=Brotonthovivens ammoniilytica TaxID=2981725 RepID=A0ABT2TND6_9FIRM|nr:MFS transporter [Brotonthovivens ammoniilytica]MCU6763735.1 MFS transporter [Brotonthovivens ammoniilytica]SCJ33246.1 oxalate/formate antiporter family transporter [uncultured Roseburia sp.]
MNQNSAKSNFGKMGWLIIIYVLFLYMFSSTPPDTLNVTAEFFAGAMGLDSSNALLVFSAVGGFVGIPVALIFGQIVSKVGVKWPTVIILLIYAVIWFINGKAISFGLYAVIVTIITAVSNTINLVATQQIMSNWFPKKKGIALGWATMGMCFSSAIMVAVFQGMILNVGLSAPFNLMVVICIVMAVITAVWFKAYPEEAGAYPDNEPISEEEKKANLELINNYKSDFSFGKLFKTKELWMIVIIFGFLFIGLVGTVSRMIPRLVIVGIDQNIAVLWLTIASVIGIPASFFWGLIDQKIGTKKAVEIFCVLWTIMMAIAAVGSAAVSVPVSIISVVFYACLLGGLGNLMPSMVIQIFGRYDFPQANKLVVPLVVGIRSFALLIVPMMLQMSGIGNESAGYRNVFIVFMILSLVVTILAFAIKDKTIGKI